MTRRVSSRVKVCGILRESICRRLAMLIGRSCINFVLKSSAIAHLLIIIIIVILLICSQFKSIILFGPFKISADNYHAVDDSTLCVYKTAHVVGSRRVTRPCKQQNLSRAPGRACTA